MRAPGKAWDPAPNGPKRDYLGDWKDLVERVWGNGVAGFNRSFSVDSFENGLAHLVGIEEVRAGMIPEDSVVRGQLAISAPVSPLGTDSRRRPWTELPP